MGVSANNSDGPITEINLTPLVDVALVLVIIFMAVAPFALQSGIKVMQSKSTAQIGKVSFSDSIQIKLDKTGRITVNGTQTDASGFRAAVAAVLSASKDKFVIIKADETNRVGEVVALLDEAKQAGAAKLALMKN